MWEVFLDQWNGRSFFLDSSVTPTPELEMYTDAASSVGFGGYFSGKWFQGQWPPSMRLSKERGISIEWQELFPIVVACALWFPQFSGKRLQFWCDNESVVALSTRAIQRHHGLGQICSVNLHEAQLFC